MIIKSTKFLSMYNLLIHNFLFSCWTKFVYLQSFILRPYKFVISKYNKRGLHELQHDKRRSHWFRIVPFYCYNRVMSLRYYRLRNVLRLSFVCVIFQLSRVHLLNNVQNIFQSILIFKKKHLTYTLFVRTIKYFF